MFVRIINSVLHAKITNHVFFQNIQPYTSIQNTHQCTPWQNTEKCTFVKIINSVFMWQNKSMCVTQNKSGGGIYWNIFFENVSYKSLHDFSGCMKASYNALQFGPDITTTSIPTSPECADKCRMTSWCIAATYNKKSRFCYLHNKKRTIYNNKGCCDHYEKRNTCQEKLKSVVPLMAVAPKPKMMDATLFNPKLKKKDEKCKQWWRNQWLLNHC